MDFWDLRIKYNRGVALFLGILVVPILLLKTELTKTEASFVDIRPLSSPSSLAAYIYVYKNPVATFQALTYFRRSYPNAPILMLGLNGYNFSLMSMHFNASYVHFDSDVYQKLNKDLKIYSNFLIWIFDFFENEEFVMYLEDDVRVIYNVSFQSYKGVLNGCCANKIGPLVQNFQELKDYLYTGHGGSVFNRIQFLQLFNNRTAVDEVSSAIEENIVATGGDFKISTLILAVGGNIHCLSSHQEYVDGGFSPLSLSQIERYYKSVAVVHQWKRDYAAPVPKYIEDLIQRSSDANRGH
jgi:hypothetical protein